MHRLSAYVIVHRTQSNQTANGIRLDGGRNPIGRRTETVGGAAVSAAPTSKQSKDCTNKAYRTIISRTAA